MSKNLVASNAAAVGEKILAKVEKQMSQSAKSKAEVATFMAESSKLTKSQIEMDKIRCEEKVVFDNSSVETNAIEKTW